MSRKVRGFQAAGSATFAFRDRSLNPYAAPERLTVADAFARYAGVDLLATIAPEGPDRARLAHEANALRHWSTPHVPAVFAVDKSVGACLIESIEPGSTLIETQMYPRLDSIAELGVA